VIDYLKTHKPFEIENANKFREEIADLGSINPILIALGSGVYQILVRNFKNEYKFKKSLILVIGDARKNIEKKLVPFSNMERFITSNQS